MFEPHLKGYIPYFFREHVETGETFKILGPCLRIDAVRKSQKFLTALFKLQNFFCPSKDRFVSEGSANIKDS